MKLNLSALLRELELHCEYPQDVQLTGLTCVNTDVSDGFLFIWTPNYLMPAENSREHIEASVADALQRGAVALVLEAPLSVFAQVPQIIVPHTRKALSRLAACWYGQPAQGLKLVGVTGTNGKTSIAYMVEQMLNHGGHHTALVSTVENRYLNRIIPTVNTTPEAPVLHGFFRQAKDDGVSHAVMEVSSHGLSLNRVDDVDFDVAVFTNLTRDHLNHHGTMADYFAAKKSLFDSVERSCGTAIINIDDAYGAELTASLSHARVVTYGIDAEADLRATNIRYLGFTIAFDLWFDGESYALELPFVGKHYVYNCLAAIAVGFHYGLAAEVIFAGLQKTVIPGRFERLMTSHPAEIVVDFAHTPDGVEKTLIAARAICRGRLIAVMGSGGNRDEHKRPMIGRLLSLFCDLVVLTSDTPRFEDPEKILADIERGFLANTPYEKYIDRREAIEYSLRVAEANDLIMILGRGHETYQNMAGRHVPFVDKDVVLECLTARSLDAAEDACELA
ncbi:UDP-N-acetylmuramoyl-L-alanyl-D-glutamate--2,6-diaminopimelate ligase [Oceanobacter mangrovi]|uniref:UDP-N-acetylmuramoyl-L-alanyl-D-glutamate--2, 6-diaminopimelate ligase n=1 Tax=Oceanobacter mangrovi TaxID=2862510 RepID=UPI001C8D1D60|nr:UDP-N-acetylmuramoyl-L-alanyl-D-glutamate--2,6-diaminopimelate ligase [Oceanobacter mangrovi]